MNTRSVLMIASGVLVTLVTVALARLSFGLILPPMRQSLNLSYEQAGHLGTATALGYLCLVMVAGALAARYGGRLAILLGLVCVILGFAGLSMASEYKQLLALMTLLGIGTAFAYTPLISLIGTWFPARRGLVIGLLNSGVGTGMMSAGWIVPYLAQLDVDHGWRWVWMLFAGVAIGALLASLAFVRDPPRPARSPRALTTAERRSARMAVFRNPYVVIVGIIYGIVGMTYIVQAIFMYSYALAADIDADVAGALAAFMGMLGIVFGPVWGSLSDQLGRGQSLTLSMLMAFVSTLVPVLSPTLYGFATHYLILGVAVTGMFTSSLAASTERVNVDQAPLAVSYVTMFFAAGQLVGPSAAGWLIGVTDAFRFTFGVSAGLILLGALLSFQLTRLPRSV
ncbi:two-component system OmpR family osmolarity sensor histidine kinase EnvZ protein [Salinisphaera shabanensis E1L3A]|uniref:Two-component system OmpR family osmolarity sensor histidine kinase EnvZ protein n=1 Tax=Salinisphaera shabanensis E1L3A TaxID=1033802 RepID=U2FVP1_9GAMM|nr:MFS transporter [Salinisphaera shabanensis]ERJ18368.1 two-component system OmpR family osmolarity sensor histidine kinase EnvZ protein [Salinisphaera shabanensis E1L3A]